MNTQFEFEGFQIDLMPLPDETLFSWCSRYHKLAALGSHRATCQRLFGHHQIGTAHDFPARIQCLASHTLTVLGTAQEIVAQRTLLPFYLPFRSVSLADRAMQAMFGHGIGHLKYQLGLLTSGLGASHPLKACPDCIKEDLSQFGWAYWHRSHQLPGVWTCLRHNRPLQLCAQKHGNIERYSWILPEQKRMLDLVQNALLSNQDDTTEAWRKLAQVCEVVVSNESGSYADPVKLSQTLRIRLCGMGLTHPGGRVRWQLMEPLLTQCSKRLSGIPEFEGQATTHYLRNQLQAILTGRSLMHPLRYLIWVAEFFNDWYDFAVHYSESYVQSARQSIIDNNTKSLPIKHPTITLDLGRVVAGEISVSHAAKLAGIDYVTAAARFAASGYTTPPRPKMLNEEVRSKLICALNSGEDKASIATALGLSVSTVTRVMRTTPGLQQTWHDVRTIRTRNHYRQIWQEIAGMYPLIGIQRLRKMNPAAFAWLYRNDKEWLKQSSISTLPIPRANHATQRLANNDQRIADVLYRYIQDEFRLPMSLVEMKKAIPQLNKVIEQPHRWPRSAHLLKKLLVNL